MVMIPKTVGEAVSYLSTFPPDMPLVLWASDLERYTVTMSRQTYEEQPYMEMEAFTWVGMDELLGAAKEVDSKT